MSDDNKSKKRYHTINVPKPLAEKIDEVIINGKHHYTNVPDFVKEAIRRYLRELGYFT